MIQLKYNILLKVSLKRSGLWFWRKCMCHKKQFFYKILPYFLPVVSLMVWRKLSVIIHHCPKLALHFLTSWCAVTHTSSANSFFFFFFFFFFFLMRFTSWCLSSKGGNISASYSHQLEPCVVGNLLLWIGLRAQELSPVFLCSVTLRFPLIC